jgi:putative Mn2+ efflux pump MntP
MNFFTVFLIALGLSADAFAVAMSSGMAAQRPRVRDAVKIGLAFGIFQAVMPVIGWFAGTALAGFITELDHWVAFGLLLFVGSKMIYDAIYGDSCEVGVATVSLGVLLMLSIATSIDALAVGVSLSFIDVAVITPAALIGVTTFLLSTAGVFIGHRCGAFFERKVEVVGGFILIGIGSKILLDHLQGSGLTFL